MAVPEEADMKATTKTYMRVSYLASNASTATTRRRRVSSIAAFRSDLGKPTIFGHFHRATKSSATETTRCHFLRVSSVSRMSCRSGRSILRSALCARIEPGVNFRSSALDEVSDDWRTTIRPTEQPIVKLDQRLFLLVLIAPPAHVENIETPAASPRLR
jgi:hypothetical protein